LNACRMSKYGLQLNPPCSILCVIFRAGA